MFIGVHLLPVFLVPSSFKYRRASLNQIAFKLRGKHKEIESRINLIYNPENRFYVVRSHKEFRCGDKGIDIY